MYHGSLHECTGTHQAKCNIWNFTKTSNKHKQTKRNEMKGKKRETVDIPKIVVATIHSKFISYKHNIINIVACLNTKYTIARKQCAVKLNRIKEISWFHWWCGCRYCYLFRPEMRYKLMAFLLSVSLNIWMCDGYNYTLLILIDCFATYVCTNLVKCCEK